jgi:uncharacterized membrane protein
MTTKFKHFLVSFGVFFVVDLIWLGILAQPVYDATIGDFLRDQPNWFAAILFYILFVIGLQYFALNPAVEARDGALAMKNGALYGFFTYMTYELTNWAVIEGWSATIVPIDILWGTFLAFAVTSISFRIIDRFSIK